ncbi:MAG: YihY/virulence factor BrkB family protein [Gemmatimonadaceae bacterium]|nr:YihY/virulence factor BrkB family protein [Gemmatimonadaceae bacterium]
MPNDRKRPGVRDVGAMSARAIGAWFEHSAPRHGAAIAYYALFAMAPTLLVVIAVAGLVFGREAARGEVVAQLSGVLGESAADAVQEILRRARTPRDGIVASALGVVGLLFAATGVFMELEAALNKVWHVRRTSSGFGLAVMVRRRLRSLGIVAGIGFLLLLSLIVSGALNVIAPYFDALTPGWLDVVTVANHLVSWLVTAALFALLYRFLPEVQLAWNDVAVGALATALLFGVGQRLIGMYLGRSALASPFGAAGTIAVLMAWVYYSSMIVLLGAEFTREYVLWRGREPEAKPGAIRVAGHAA